MKLSPPGRLSITTGLPQRVDSFSWISRAPMSAPAPGPNGMINRTGRCGHCCTDVCARACVAMRAGAASSAKARRRVNVISAPPRRVLLVRSEGADASRPIQPAQRSLRGLLVAGLMDHRDLGALLRNRSGELLARAGARRRADADHPGAKGGIGD